MDHAAHPMQAFLRQVACLGKRSPVARVSGGLLISALLHLAIIICFGPTVPISSTAWEQIRRELTVTLISEAPVTAPSKLARLAGKSARPNPVPVPLPPVSRYFETREVDVPARAINDVLLHYPPSAYKQAISGEVKLKLFINQDGGVDEVEIIASEPKGIFDAAAMAAATQLRYSPALKDGVPVKMTRTIAITFDPTTNPL